MIIFLGGVKNCYGQICAHKMVSHYSVKFQNFVLYDMPSRVLKLPNPSHDIPELHTISRSPDLEALKFVKGPVGLEGIHYFIFEYRMV